MNKKLKFCYLYNMATQNQIRKWLKDILRKQKVVYKDLAKELGRSESSVKRIFTDKNLTLEDLTKVCNFLGISTGDALSASSQSYGELEQLTPEQESFLCSNAYADYAFLKIFTGFNPEDIRAELGLSKSEFQQIIADLKKMRLICELTSGKIHALKRGPFIWSEKGDFRQKQGRRFFQTVVQDLEHLFERPVETALSEAFELYLTEETFGELKDDLQKLIKKYKQINKLKQLSSKTTKLQPVAVVIGVQTMNAWKKVLLEENSNLPIGTPSRASIDK